MRQLLTTTLFAALAASFIAGPATQASAQAWGLRHDRFARTIERVTSMPMDQQLQRRARRHGLNVVNVMWEDTGRFQGSSVGPNISDLTLQVRQRVAGGIQTHLLPVIRHPNFSDRTADIPADALWVRVGNQRANGGLEAVPLTEVLQNMKEYLSEPGSLLGDGDFLAERDTHFLVSAQHVFVPLPRSGQAEFNPVLYNYQSSPGSPAVLTLLITRQGTSATIIDNTAGDQSLQGWGQQLFHNNAGQRTTFSAERRSAVERRMEAGQTMAQDQGALEEGADMMMLVQVPLVHRSPRRSMAFGAGGMTGGLTRAEAAPAPTSATQDRSDVERAVIGHGEDMGPFREMAGMRLVRDTRFPVRVTVQFYRATSNGVISAADLRDVKRQIDRVYEEGDFVGSLVVPENERTRPTDWVRIRRGLAPRAASPAAAAMPPLAAWVYAPMAELRYPNAYVATLPFD